MFEKEIVYYQAHRTSLREKYAEKRVVIAGDQILGYTILIGKPCRKSLRQDRTAHLW
jgi:hypothetical protein